MDRWCARCYRHADDGGRRSIRQPGNAASSRRDQRRVGHSLRARCSQTGRLGFASRGGDRAARRLHGCSAMAAGIGVLAAGRRHSVGCPADGTVVAAGRIGAPECSVTRWTDVITVAAGNVHAAANTGRSHTVGLRADGTVLATGWNDDGQGDLADWRGVVAVSAGWRRTLGLLADGRVVAAGRGAQGQCEVQSWREIEAVSCGDWHSVALRADGRALAVGNNRRGQCAIVIGVTSPLSRPGTCTP